ncbi:ATP-grasp domain-containing protein [Kutzneria kofuensis]|uniref:Biotin carboxylase n=1 Tax=Kutzneria kofuensis TaxID=103725 RepID=A0A7W9KRE4_9PSEU|nr:ATP-grasp domain-containing protein [Kutzneria kofuensis]MBB5897347.1 biotin carboxylase [Kutzneria kofuensis]
MTERPIIVVGFVAALQVLSEFLPANSLIIVEEPDVVRKRDVRAHIADAPLVRELIEWEYQLPGAADTLLVTRPDLTASAVVPLVEYATTFAARLAERLGTPGAGLCAAELMRDKSLLRKVTRAAGVPNPLSEEAASAADVARFMTAVGGPVVLKPANRQGAVGTQIVHDPSSVAEAWESCVQHDEGMFVPDRERAVRMLVEEYVAGHEYSVEMVVRDGESLFANVTDKVLYPGPRPVELGHVLPAAISPELALTLEEGTLAVLRAVGFGSGVVHCEWIVRDGTPYLVECAGRFPGDGIIEMIERAYGEPIGQHYFAVMRGLEPPPLPRTAPQAAAVRFMQVPPGEIVSIDGLDAARAIPGVVSVGLGPGVGDTVRELRSSWDRVGSAMVLAPTAGEAVRLAEKAIDQVHIVTAGGPQWNSR